MKKIILLTLLCTLLLLCIIGCDGSKNGGEDSTSSRAEETTEINNDESSSHTDEQTTPPDESTEELVETTQSCGGGELVEDEDLIYELERFLEENFHAAVDPAVKSVVYRIREIKHGTTQPLLVEFDPSSCYFVCAYYQDDTHEERGYCCLWEYTTWVRYENASAIAEYYNGERIAVAFQINKASTVTDIVSDEASVPEVEHFRIYAPSFTGGFNTKKADAFEETFIYLNPSDKSRIYYSMDVAYHEYCTFPIVSVEDELYIPILVSSTYADGRVREEDLYENLEEYYDVIVDILEKNAPYIVVKNGTTRTYGLISVEDFATVLLI